MDSMIVAALSLGCSGCVAGAVLTVRANVQAVKRGREILARLAQINQTQQRRKLLELSVDQVMALHQQEGSTDAFGNYYPRGYWKHYDA